mmetsp:Transcript_14814/g.28219  ORF Transcript_14814/g.28219 Transcript_14814/m.28219 type:complete len:216 (-) Transcript_14814:795-1442(-)
MNLDSVEERVLLLLRRLFTDRVRLRSRRHHLVFTLLVIRQRRRKSCNERLMLPLKSRKDIWEKIVRYQAPGLLRRLLPRLLPTSCRLTGLRRQVSTLCRLLALRRHRTLTTGRLRLLLMRSNLHPRSSTGSLRRRSMVSSPHTHPPTRGRPPFRLCRPPIRILLLSSRSSSNDRLLNRLTVPRLRLLPTGNRSRRISSSNRATPRLLRHMLPLRW